MEKRYSWLPPETTKMIAEGMPQISAALEMLTAGLASSIEENERLKATNAEQAQTIADLLSRLSEVRCRGANA